MKKIIVVALFAMISCGNAMASGGLKIGYVNVEQLLTQSPQVSAVNAVMTERFGGKKAELDEMKKEIQGMEENYKRNELVMTEDKLNELKKIMIGKFKGFKQKETTLGQEVQTMRSQELAKLKKSVSDVINKIAKKDKYDLILSEGVIYSSEQLDITNTVLEEMKKIFKK